MGDDESIQSSKSQESMPKEITEASDTPLKSSKETGKNLSNTSAETQSDFESISDDIFIKSCEEEEITKEKVKEPSLKKPKPTF